MFRFQEENTIKQIVCKTSFLVVVPETENWNKRCWHRSGSRDPFVGQTVEEGWTSSLRPLLGVLIPMKSWPDPSQEPHLPTLSPCGVRIPTSESCRETGIHSLITVKNRLNWGNCLRQDRDEMVGYRISSESSPMSLAWGCTNVTMEALSELGSGRAFWFCCID